MRGASMSDVCRERTNYSRCGKPTLPRMTVCAYHATPDATRIVMEEMAAEIAALQADIDRRDRDDFNAMVEGSLAD